VWSKNYLENGEIFQVDIWKLLLLLTGMTRDDLFNTNASIVRDLVQACGKYCPKAMMLIITNPVSFSNSVFILVFKVQLESGLDLGENYCNIGFW